MKESGNSHEKLLENLEYFGITNELGLEYKLVLMNHLKNYTFNWAFNKIVLCSPFLAGHCESMWDGVPWAHYPGLATNRQVLDWVVQRGDAEGEWRGHQRHVWMAHRPLSGLCQEKYKSRSQWHIFKEWVHFLTVKWLFYILVRKLWWCFFFCMKKYTFVILHKKSNLDEFDFEDCWNG